MKYVLLIVVVGVAAVASAATFVFSGDAATGGCVDDAPLDPAYEAEFEEPVAMGEGPQVVQVSRDGQPVTEATVCVRLVMTDMRSMGTTGEARELGDGRYEVPLNFEMGDAWDGVVLVAEEGAPAVSVPITVEVMEDHGDS